LVVVAEEPYYIQSVVYASSGDCGIVNGVCKRVEDEVE
jgi:hypothetical protein